MRQTHLILCAILCAFPGWSQAEALSWEQAVSEAARSNTDVLAAQETLRQADLAVRSATAPFLPSAALGASLSQSGAYADTPGWGDFGPPVNGSSASLSASWNLFNGFKDLAGWDKARRAREQAQAQAQAALAAAGYALRAAFVGVLEAHAQVALTADIVKRQQYNVDLVQLNVQAGTDNKASLLASQAALAQAQYRACSAQRGLEEATLSLAQALGRSQSEHLDAAGELQPPGLPAVPDLGALVAGLPAVRQAQAQYEQAIDAQAQARGAWLPSLNASTSVGRSGGDWLADNGAWSAGLSLNWALFNGGARLYSQQSAASAVESARLALRTAQQEGLSALKAAWDGYVDAVELADVQAQLQASAEARAEVTRAQYHQGLTTYNIWDQIEGTLISAQTNALSSRGAAQRAAAAWQRAIARSLWP